MDDTLDKNKNKNNNDDDDDNENLEEFLQGDDFLTEEQREERAAKERRLARKRRLQSLQAKVAEAEEKEKTQQQQNGDDDSMKKSKLDSKDQENGTAMETATTTATLIEEKTIPLKKDPEQQNDNDKGDDGNDDDDDNFDIFSSSVSPVAGDKAARIATTATNTNTNTNNNKNGNVDQQQDWDDAEGYYKATIGEMIHVELGSNVSGSSTSNSSSNGNDNNNNNAQVQFRVSGVIGKGVFSTVLKATTESITNTSMNLPPQVAIKCIRHNETMAKAAYNEIRFLQRFNKVKTKKDEASSSTSNGGSGAAAAAAARGIVPLLLPTEDTIPPVVEYRGHTLLVFPYMAFNLRDVLTKFGKGVGLSLTAVRSYFGQLLAAATHLKQHNIIHSDLKPDNILVSQDFSTVRLCDFGSAVDATESSSFEMITPYLVSRFYRAPEIILGLVPTFAIDLWSLAVTVAELFLGKVLFQGINNNDMLRVMMQHMGPFSNRLIRQHLVQTKRFPLPAHFTQEAAAFFFRQESVDPVSGQPVHKTVSLQTFATATLQSKLLKAKSAKDSRVLVLRFSDLLQKCLTLDPTRRIAVKMALQHDFFKEPTTATSTTSSQS